MIEEQYRGKAFRQIAPRLRWQAGRDRHNVDSFRPMNQDTGKVVGEPPVIVFDDDARVDVGELLRLGRIVEAEKGAKPSGPLSDHDAHAAGKGKKAESEAGPDAEGGS